MTSKYDNTSKPIYCKELDQTFPSASNCAKRLGLSRQNIVKVLKGKRLTCSGYHFNYHEEAELDEGSNKISE